MLNKMAFKYVFVTLIATNMIATSRAGVIGAVTYAHSPVVSKVVVNPTVDAVASTHENVVRSFGGTVSQYSKTIDTPYSSVHKEDTRITNNVYTPAITKTVTYAAPAKAVTYASTAPAHNVYTHSSTVADKPLYASAATPNTDGYTEQHHESAANYVTHEHHELSHAHENVANQHYQHQHQHQHQHEHTPSTAVYKHAEPIATKTVSYASPTSASVPVFNYHHHAPAAVTTATTTYNHGPHASTYSHNAPGLAAYGTSQTVHYSPAEMVSHMSFDGFGTHWGF